MYRITTGMMATTLKQNMSSNLRQLATVENQISTTKKINKPSDDPAGLVRALRLRTDMVKNEQYISNIEDSISFMETTDSALNNLNSALTRVRELMVQGANGTNEEDALNSIKEEINQLTEQFKTVANTTYGSKYIFSGSNVTQEPYSDTGWTGNSNALMREIGSGVTMQVNIDMKSWFIGPGTSTSGANATTDLSDTVTYADPTFNIQIDGEASPVTIHLTAGLVGGANIALDMQTQIRSLSTATPPAQDAYSDVTVTYNNADGRYVITSGTEGDASAIEVTAATTGNDVSAALKIGRDNGGEEISGIFNVMDQVMDALDAGEFDTVSSLLGKADLKINTLLTQRAIIGAKTNRLEMQQTRLESNQISYTELLANTEDADMAELAIALKIQENVYNASLAAGASIIQPSLLDFLD